MTFDPMSVEVTCVTLPKDHCVQVPRQYINVCGYSDQFCKLPHTYTYIGRRGGDSLEKVIMQGCVEGRRKPGRPRTRWIDQIKSMVGCPLHELYNLVQDRQRWCDVVAVASCQPWQDRTDRPTGTHTTYITTYYVQNEWSHSLLLNSVQVRQKWWYGNASLWRAGKWIGPEMVRR